jgi:hypothetical protein
MTSKFSNYRCYRCEMLNAVGIDFQCTSCQQHHARRVPRQQRDLYWLLFPQAGVFVHTETPHLAGMG